MAIARHFYNEFDPGAAAWLRELMRAGLIPEGEVDERSIAEVQADDLRGFAQCHFFAGISGWPLALRLAGWPDDRPVWTGSCPCQPFSSAGKRQGTADERHLWPEFFRLIKECRPPVVFGEQVASAEVVGTELEAAFVVAVRRGDFARANKFAKRLAQSKSFHFHRRWVDGVRADLAGAGYAFGASVLGAHSVGAPHIRQRLYWVADAVGAGVRPHGPGGDGGAPAEVPGEVRQQRVRPDAGPGVGPVVVGAGGLADADGRQPRHGGLQPGGEHGQQPQDGGTGGRVGDAAGERREGSADGITDAHDQGDGPQRHAAVAGCNGSGFWDAFDLVPCRDGKWRRVPARGAEPGLQLLADGLPAGLGGMWVEGAGVHPLAVEKVEGRVGLLRGFGNAIVPEVAAAFIRAYRECKS